MEHTNMRLVWSSGFSADDVGPWLAALRLNKFSQYSVFASLVRPAGPWGI